jgi:hypothetical protein
LFVCGGNSGCRDAQTGKNTRSTNQYDPAAITTTEPAYATRADGIAPPPDCGQQRRKARWSARAEYDLRPALGEQEGRRLTDAAARAGDDDDLAFDS